MRHTEDEKIPETSVFEFILDIIGIPEFIPLNVGQPAMGRLTEPRQFGVQIRWRPQF